MFCAIYKWWQNFFRTPKSDLKTKLIQHVMECHTFKRSNFICDGKIVNKY